MGDPPGAAGDPPGTAGDPARRGGRPPRGATRDDGGLADELVTTPPPPGAPPPGVPAPRGFVPALIAVGLVVSVISSLGAPLVPELADRFGESLTATQWSLTATLLVGAVTAPVIGRLGDGPHRRTVLLVALAIVAAGGVLSAVASSLGLLIAGRALQGLGLALLPLTVAAAREHLPPERAAPVIATLSVAAAVGVGLGYPLTGLVAEVLGTSAAFWLGAGAALVALAAAAAYVPAPGPTALTGRLDVLGAVLIGGGVLALLLGLERAPDAGWLAAQTLGLAAASGVLLAAFTAVELRTRHPLVELRLVVHRAVLAANLTALVLGMALYLGVSLVTQLVQLDEGMDGTVLLAGVLLVPLSILSYLSSKAAPALEARAGHRAALPVGAVTIAAALGFLAVTGDAPWQAAISTGVVGIGIGLTFAALPGLIVGAVPAHETSSAMSLYQVVRYVGFSIGSGLSVTLLRAFDGGTGGTPSPDAYAATAAAGAGVCLLAAVVAWVALGPADAAPAGDHAAAA